MLAVMRFDGVTDPGFRAGATAAMEALAARPGHLRGRLGRSPDEPGSWVLTSEWVGVGAYRRALGSYEVKLALTPLLAHARQEASAFEVVAASETDGR